MANIQGWRWVKFGLWVWRSLLLQPGCWDERAGGARAALGGKCMATNPGPQPWGTLPLIHHGKYRWPLVMSAVGTRSEPLRPVFYSKKCLSSPKDCKHKGTPPTLVTLLGLATGTLRWSHNDIPSHSLPLYSLQPTREIQILALLTGR